MLVSSDETTHSLILVSDAISSSCYVMTGVVVGISLLWLPVAIMQHGPYVLLLFISFLSFFLQRKISHGLTANRHETLPHNRKWVNLKTRSKIWGSSPPPKKKIEDRKRAFLARFETTSHFDHEFLRNGTRYRHSENGVANYDLSRDC